MLVEDSVDVYLTHLTKLNGVIHTNLLSPEVSIHIKRGVLLLIKHNLLLSVAIILVPGSGGPPEATSAPDPATAAL